MQHSLGEPLTFYPIFKERIWGGRRLESVFGKKLPPGKRIGESWEIVDRQEAQSVVRQGPLAGQTLHQLWLEHRSEVFGETIPDALRFPLMAKLLDAREQLSIQVHPPADIAEKLGGEPKSEFWYCADAEPGAEFIAGFRRGVTRSTFQQALERCSVPELVHRIKVKAGDAFYLPSGRLHALGAGSLIVEISENSDTTYRVFDWNRAEENRTARRLHVAESTRAINFEDFEPGLIQPAGEELLRCPYFVAEKWELQKARIANVEHAFALFLCLGGEIEAGGLRFRSGEFFLVPALGAATEVQPHAPATTVLRVTMPSR